MIEDTAAPLVSVILPTYRPEAHIDDAVASVLAQTLGDFELIIGDDCSDDGTAESLTRFTDPRIRLLPSDRRLGMAGNWNRCLSAARGRFIKVLPHDDVIAPNCLAEQVAALSAAHAHDLAFAFCARTIIDAEGRALFDRGFPSRQAGSVPESVIVRACMRSAANPIGEPGAVLFRRADLDTVGHFDGSLPFVVDVDFWLRLLVGRSAYYDPRPLASFRISHGSYSVQHRVRQATQQREFLARLAARSSPPIPATDRALGALRASLNPWLRWVVYRLALR